MNFKDKKASYKAVIYFNDSNCRTFYSRDYSNSSSRTRKPELGLARLIRMIENTFKYKYETALIYDCISNDLKHKYINSVKQF